MYQSITFNWKSPKSVIPITSYKISYTDKDGNEKDTVSAGGNRLSPSCEIKLLLADTSMQLTGLKEETEYTFYITAQNEAGDSEKSDGVTLKTKKPGTISRVFLFMKIYNRKKNQHKPSIFCS